MRFRYQSLLLVSILIIVLGMNLVSAVDVDSCSASSDIGIADSIEESSLDSLCKSYSSSDVEISNSYSDDDVGLENLCTEDNGELNDFTVEDDDHSSSQSLTLSCDESEDKVLDVKSRNVLKDNAESNASIEGNSSNVNRTFHVNSSNFYTYFDFHGFLKEEYGGSILIFEGLFENKGIFTIDKDNTSIISNNSQFFNTVFCLNATGVVLANFNITLDKTIYKNKNAGIYIAWDNITVFNNTLNYFCPRNTNYGIYANDNYGLNLINNTINFIGQPDSAGYKYAVFLNYCYDALVSGNNINTILPLCDVNWGAGISMGVKMDKVSALAAEGCDNMQLIYNNIYSTIHGANGRNPTLSTVLIYACDNSTISGNNITVEDFYTPKGTANFLYALDLYKLNNVRVLNNTIDVFTYGGKGEWGTAYPIQVAGPAYNIIIAYNHLHSVNNGPNIGIYSYNYYGSTQIDIISNFINVTGKAGNYGYCLVAGIEAQDSNDRILNNTIIVDTVGGYKPGDRIYGISYAQSTGGNHKYEIKYNNVTVPGAIAISLNRGILDSTTSDSNVMYNILNTAIGEGGDSAVAIGGHGRNNVVRYNTNGSNPHRHMSERDLPDWYLNFESPRDSGFSLFWIHSDDSSSHPGFANDDSNGNGFKGNGSGRGNSLNGNGNGYGFNFDSDVNGRNSRFSRSNATHGDLNSTHYTVGDSGVSLAAASASAGSRDSSSADANVEKNAYEINEKDSMAVKSIDYVQLAGICIAVLFLLLVGYKRQKDKEEEE